MIPLTAGELTLRDAAPLASLTGRCSRVRTAGRGSGTSTSTVHAIPYRWYTPTGTRLTAMAGGNESVAVDVLSFAATADIQPDDVVTDDTHSTLRWTITGFGSTTAPAFKVAYGDRRSA